MSSAVRPIHRAFGRVRLLDRYELAVERRGPSVVHRITQRPAMGPPLLPSHEAARRSLEGCLESVWGIGPTSAALLRSTGVTTVRELAAIERFALAAGEVVAEWDAGDLEGFCGRLTRRLGEHGHLLSTLASALVAPEDVVFLDLETMGLWNNVVFLAGVGRVVDGVFVVNQFLAPGFANEAAVVDLTLAELSKAKVVVTYNGCTADLPWLAARAFYYGLGQLPPFIHVDLMYGTRRRFQRQEARLDSVRLPVVSAELLGHCRPPHDIEGWLIPLVYEAYADAPDERQGLLVPVLDHNRADIEVLVSLLELLASEAVR